MGSVRLEESGEWSGGVPECRTAHAAHQQRVERGGRRPAVSRSFFKAAKRIFAGEFASHETAKIFFLFFIDCEEREEEADAQGWATASASHPSP